MFPTRQALLTGRNHHSVGMGGITEIATAAPGYSSVLPNNKAPLALTLKLNGYSTAQFGKCHEVPVWQTSAAGPFNAWPTGGGGFEYFYGFIGGENNQWDPALYEGTTPIEPPKTPAEGYHLTDDLTDKAIAWGRQQKALMGDKPFFIYFAPGATHAPHAARRNGREVQGSLHGWDSSADRVREAGRNWVSLRRFSPRAATRRFQPGRHDPNSSLASVDGNAAFMETPTIASVGCSRAWTNTDNTLIYLIIGDNGARQARQGAFNGINSTAWRRSDPRFLDIKLDEFGGEGSYGHFAVGWAGPWTHLSVTKKVASHWGGTRNGTIVSGPAG